MATEHQTSTQVPASGEAAFPPFDKATFAPTIFWLVITFGALYLMMSRYALPRVQNILKTRSDKIHGSLSDARKMRQEAQDAAAAYEKTLAEARSRSQSLAQETRAKVKLEQQTKRQSIEAGLDHKLQGAEAQIAQTKAGAMSNVGQIANEAAAAIVTHITGKEADADAVDKALAAVAEVRI